MPVASPSVTSSPSCESAGPDMTRRRWLLGMVGVVFSAPVLAQRTVLEVIEPRFRDPEELASMLRPLVGPEGSVSVAGGRLIVRATPSNLADLRRVLEAVDGRPRLLDISVADDVDSTLLRSEAGVDDRGARVFSSRSAAGGATVRTIRVQEGQTASLVVGRQSAAPTVTVVPGPRPGAATVIQATPPSSIHALRVRARVQGDRVTVELSSAGQRPVPRVSGTVESQALETVVHGRLGEWLPVGGVGRVRESTADAIVHRSDAAGRDRGQTYIKVDVAGEDPSGAR